MHGWHLVPISIHTLRMEGDLLIRALTKKEDRFQSTPSAWRVTSAQRLGSAQWRISIHTLRMEGDDGGYMYHIHMEISIHTLRVEGDRTGSINLNLCVYFNPHPPRGG